MLLDRTKRPHAARQLPQAGDALHGTFHHVMKGLESCRPCDCLSPVSQGVAPGSSRTAVTSARDKGKVPEAILGRSELPCCEARPVHCTIFWPSDIGSFDSVRGDGAVSLLGWAFAAGSDGIVAVVASAIRASDISPAWSHHNGSDSEGIRIIGELRSNSDAGTEARGGRAQGSAPHCGSANGGDAQTQAKSGSMGAQTSLEASAYIWIQTQGLHASSHRRRNVMRSPYHSRVAVFPRIVRLSIDASPESANRSFRQQTGATADPCQPAITVITFSPPDHGRLQFISLEPLVLTPQELVQHTRTEEIEKKLESFLAASPARWFEVTGGFTPELRPGNGLRRAIRCINQVKGTRHHLHARRTTTRALGSEATFERSWQTAALASIVVICQGMQDVLNHPVWPCRSGWKPAVQISFTAEQLALRLTQVSSFPPLAASLRRQQQSGDTPTELIASRYIATWNGLWLIANDIILGWAAGTLLMQNASALGFLSAPFIDRWLIRSLENGCQWLDNWPGGLKLNTELSSFYLDMYVGLIAFCSAVIIKPLCSALPRLLWGIGLASRFGGLSLLFCIGCDALHIFSLHVTQLHVIAQRQYRAVLDFLAHSVHLFRGRKRTVLSRRQDFVPAQYDMDQLLLSTILFTLALFLFPTVAVYHYLFACTRACVEILVASFQVGKEALNHVPLLPLMLRGKDPGRVPGGILLFEVEQPTNSPVTYSKLELRSRPLSVAEIFDGYSRHLLPLARIPYIALKIVTGDEI
ncbi:unnamed protein product [Parajaminaea phylloscopi]